MPSDFSWIARVIADVDPSVKAAEDSPASDAKSSNPTAKADDQTTAPSEGGFSRELSSKVREFVGNVNIDSAEAPAAPSSPSGQMAVQEEIGLKAAPPGDAGGAGANEGAAARPPDSGTSLPASADAGEKYSAEVLQGLAKESEEKLVGALVELGDELRAQLIAEHAKRAEATAAIPAAPPSAAAAAPPVAPTAEDDGEAAKLAAAQRGYELAAALAGDVTADEVAELLGSCVKQGEELGELVYADLCKLAEGMPPEDDGGEAASPHEETAPPMGGPPMGGADGGGAGMPGGEGVDPAMLQELVAALIEEGVTPEELMQLVAGGEAGAEAGAGAGPEPMAGAMPPGGGGMPPGMAPPKMAAEDVARVKVAAQAARAVIDRGDLSFFRPSGKLTGKAAALRSKMREFIGDLTRRKAG